MRPVIGCTPPFDVAEPRPGSVGAYCAPGVVPAPCPRVLFRLCRPWRRAIRWTPSRGGVLMNRRDALAMLAAATGTMAVPAYAQQLTASPAAAQPKIVRKGRIKQGLWRVNFGANSALSFDDQCREAARLGAYGFDLIPPADWPTLRKHGLEPLLAGAGPVTFENGLIHPEVHDQLEKDIKPHIDMVAKEGVKTFISIGGQRRGMPYEQAAEI